MCHLRTYTYIHTYFTVRLFFYFVFKRITEFVYKLDQKIEYTMVLRIAVTIHGVPEKFLIVCEKGQETVEWLCKTAYNRFIDRYTDTHHPYYFLARRLTDRSILSLTEPVENVLKDNESVEIGINLLIFLLVIRKTTSIHLDVAQRFDDRIISTSTYAFFEFDFLFRLLFF